jgi:hypothetical protein
MAKAVDLISFAMAAVNRHPSLLYGQRAINGLSQRGPNSYDCIGFYRWCVQSIAPNLWPTSWGGEDSWTVPDYYSNCSGHLSIDDGPALPGDALIWIDKSGGPQHIGIADGLGNVISALNTVKNICIVPTKSISYPTLKVIHTGLEQKVATITPPGQPIGIARIGTDAAIRGIGPDNVTYLMPLGSDIVVYGEVTQVGFGGGNAYVVVESNSGKAIHLLARNTTAYWPDNTPDAASAALQTKIDKAVADLTT